MNNKSKLLIFDMDNTLIHSHIDFALMKSESCQLLRNFGLEPDENLPIAQILADFKRNLQLPPALEEQIWQVIGQIELDGLINASLEGDIMPILNTLKEQCHLLVLTNNLGTAAATALGKLGLKPYFEHIFGRGQVSELKPSPQGLAEIIRLYPQISKKQMAVIGDAAIDYQAAKGCGLKFIAYNGSRAEAWQDKGLKPDLELNTWSNACIKPILELIKE